MGFQKVTNRLEKDNLYCVFEKIFLPGKIIRGGDPGHIIRVNKRIIWVNF